MGGGPNDRTSHPFPLLPSLLLLSPLHLGADARACSVAHLFLSWADADVDPMTLTLSTPRTIRNRSLLLLHDPVLGRVYYNSTNRIRYQVTGYPGKKPSKHFVLEN